MHTGPGARITEGRGRDDAIDAGDVGNYDDVDGSDDVGDSDDVVILVMLVILMMLVMVSMLVMVVAKRECREAARLGTVGHQSHPAGHCPIHPNSSSSLFVTSTSDY